MNETAERVDFTLEHRATPVAPRADPRYSPAPAAAGDVGEWLKPAVC